MMLWFMQQLQTKVITSLVEAASKGSQLAAARPEATEAEDWLWCVSEVWKLIKYTGRIWQTQTPWAPKPTTYCINLPKDAEFEAEAAAGSGEGWQAYVVCVTRSGLKLTEVFEGSLGGFVARCSTCSQKDSNIWMSTSGVLLWVVKMLRALCQVKRQYGRGAKARCAVGDCMN